MPENEQPKITGYSQLSPEKVALINEVKAHEQALGQLFKKIHESNLADARMMNVGKTQLQGAYMWLAAGFCPARRLLFTGAVKLTFNP